jgi:hypothetical protein
MKYVTIVLMSILASSVAASDAGAQWNVARFSTERTRVYTSFGLDPAVVGTLGFGRVGSLLEHDVQLTGEVSVVGARMDARDFRTRLGVQTSLLHWRSVHLTGSATAIARGTENAIYRGYNFGADLTGAVGVYRPRWFVAAEFGKDKAVITHVKHTAQYRKHLYADAKDGWYLDAGGTLHYGVVGGFAVGKTEIIGRAGWLRSERYNALTPPAYASVGVGYAF